MNNNLLALLKQSIKTLQSTLSKDELLIIKSEFTKIYDGKTTAMSSYMQLSAGDKINFKKVYQIQEPFYTISELIAIPPRTGATGFLDEAYEEDEEMGDLSTTSFVDYQASLMKEAYDQMMEIIGDKI